MNHRTEIHTIDLVEWAAGPVGTEGMAKLPDDSMAQLREATRRWNVQDKLIAALTVIALDERICKFLAANDPKALAQIHHAINSARTPIQKYKTLPGLNDSGELTDFNEYLEAEAAALSADAEADGEFYEDAKGGVR